MEDVSNPVLRDLDEAAAGDRRMKEK